MSVVRSSERQRERLLRWVAAVLAVVACSLLVAAAWLEPTFTLPGRLVATAMLLGLVAVILGLVTT